MFKAFKINNSWTSEQIMSNRFLVEEEARVNTAVLIQKESWKDRSILGSISMNVVKKAIPRNRCVRIVCTQSHKTAEIESIQIYSSAQTAEADCVPQYGFVACCMKQCVVVKLIHC